MGQDAQASTSGSGPGYWQDLLGAPETDIFGSRARSASDAGVLRRKGHLKEQDQMIEFMLRMHETHTSLEVMVKLDLWMSEHRKVRSQMLSCYQACVTVVHACTCSWVQASSADLKKCWCLSGACSDLLKC